MCSRRLFALAMLVFAGAAMAQESPSGAPAPPASPAGQNAAAPAPAASPPPEAGAVVLGDAAAGQTKAAVCGACHGSDGNPTDKQYPKLAGQNEAYIVRQLTLFKSGKRQNPIMLGFASTLSTKDMHDIGAYFASKKSLPGVADEALVARGEALFRGGDVNHVVPACMACHGPDGRGMAGTGYPQLAGQWSSYVSSKLTDWKDGVTWGADGRAAIMPLIASRLDKDDIAALSSYIEGLHTSSADPLVSGAAP